MNGLAYYNENNKDTAKWLRELICCKLIAPGIVDRRDIQDVKAEDLKDYTQVHLFAGIGGWSYALRLAGWPDNCPVWTGSCPCQPFSNAGKGEGHEDERHLWPEMFRLISECHPHVIFGEQVEGTIGHGWLDGVFGNLEKEEYTCGACVLGAHSVGAPHIRQRCYWVADSQRGSTERHRYSMAGKTDSMQNKAQKRQRVRNDIGNDCPTVGISDPASPRLERTARSSLQGYKQRSVGNLPTVRMDNPQLSKSERQRQHGGKILFVQKSERPDLSGDSFWNDYEIIPFKDGSCRRIKSGVSPLANGVPARMVKLCGAGNAIVPQVATKFITAYLEVLKDSQ